MKKFIIIITAIAVLAVAYFLFKGFFNYTYQRGFEDGQKAAKAGIQLF